MKRNRIIMRFCFPLFNVPSRNATFCPVSNALLVAWRIRSEGMNHDGMLLERGVSFRSIVDIVFPGDDCRRYRHVNYRLCGTMIHSFGGGESFCFSTQPCCMTADGNGFVSRLVVCCYATDTETTATRGIVNRMLDLGRRPNITWR